MKKETKVDKAEEDKTIQDFKATWELFKLQNPKKYEEQVANGDFDRQLEALKVALKEKNKTQ